MFQINQPYISKKKRSICMWTTNYKKLLEICFVQHVRTKSYFTIRAKKTSILYDCRKCTANCNVFKILIKKQKLTVTLFGRDGTCCCEKQICGDYENPFPLLINFSINHNLPQPKLKRKKTKSPHI